MKKLLIIFVILIFASSASATVYRWVDERGVTNFADDYDKVPPRYQNQVDEMNMPRTAAAPSRAPSRAPVDSRLKQAPPISQTLVREGDFAIKLAESLRMGRPTNEAEAENLLASAGIAPKNGWIADYPVTPDIIGELVTAVGDAADARKLVMGKEEALKVLRTAAAELELPVIAESDGYSEGPSSTAPEYAEPPVVEDYYYAEGPPVITYYLPPPDYLYLYAWVPSPFWCSGFYFPGFYILHDFHRFHHNRFGHSFFVTNHIRDSRTGRLGMIDPVRRHEGRTFGVREATRTKGFGSTADRSAARSIFERSRQRAGSNNASSPMAGRDSRSPAYRQSRQNNQNQVYNRQSNSQGFNNRGFSGRSNDPRIGRTPGQTGTRNYGAFGRQESMNRQNGINTQRPFAGQSQSLRPPSSQGSGRSFSQPQAGSQHFNSSPRGGGFSGSHLGGGFSGSHQVGGSSGSHQGGFGNSFGSGFGGGFGRGNGRF